MGIGRSRVWSWEGEGRFPGREKLAGFYGRLGRVREDGIDPGALAKWVELGPDDQPPFDEPADDYSGEEARDGDIETTRLVAEGETLVKLVRVVEVLAVDDAAHAIARTLLRLARARDREAMRKPLKALRALAESDLARTAIQRLERELQGPVAGSTLESFSHLLHEGDRGQIPA